MSEIKVDTVAEKTSANGVTVDGLNIKDSKLVTANSVVETNLTDNIVTLAKMASGTDGNIISYDASGNPVAIATGNDGQVLTSTGAGSPPAFETLSAGKIGQVIFSENAYATSTTSGSFVDVLSASGTTWETAITPSATSSKIIIVTSIMCYWEQSGNANNRGNLQVLSKTGSGSYSALVSGSVGNYDYGGNGVQHRTRISFHYQISPSTTSAVTVKLQISSSGGATGVVNDGGTNDSSLFLYEVLA
jgi:hypothetical protein